MKNQSGFATLEIILVTAIISVLAFVAVPKMSRVLDAVFLDYELKKFYSEVQRTRSLNRNASFNPSIFAYTISMPKGEIALRLNSKNYGLYKNENYIGARHYLVSGMKLSYPSAMRNINFNPDGVCTNNGTVTLTSQLGKTATIVFDTVGRWHGEKNVE